MLLSALGLLVVSAIVGLRAVGFVRWNVTFLDEKGDISHSESGLLVYETDSQEPEMTKEQVAQMTEYLGKCYGREGDTVFKTRFRLVPEYPPK